MVHERLGTDRLQGSVRLGVGPFNSRADVEAAVAAVAEIAGSRGACGGVRP
jgi:selenocysteine lyase/cysteine desulfurase